MKNLTLSVLQRIQLKALVGQQQGRAADIRLFTRIIDKLELNEEEQKRCSFQSTTIESLGQIKVTWDETATFDTQIEFNGEEYGRIRALLETWHLFTKSDMDTWLKGVLEQFSL